MIKYGDDTKGVALAALLAGNTPRRVAEEHGIPLNTVKSWRRRLKRGEIAALHPKKRNDSLMHEYVESVLRSLIAQSSVMQDREWIYQQSASAAALLYGIVFDRTIRSLELLNSITGDVSAKLRGRVHR
jgi:transposase-like protein